MHSPSPTPRIGEPAADAVAVSTANRLQYLEALEKKVLWLAVWMVHHANHIRPNRDGLKVGGHQASSASVATLLTALYFDAIGPADRVAIKPHASPIFHAIQYLLGRQTREQLERFRAFGGAQAYPSRTKDRDEVDFSTGSVGLGVAMTGFAALVRDYVRLKGLGDTTATTGRMIALCGDAELDEGNIFEALIELWKHDVRNLWWIVDYNRQSLDAVITDRLYSRFDSVFRGMDWDVVTLKYGHRLEAAFARTGGDALRLWIDSCPNSRYSALAYKGGWRAELRRDLGGTAGITELLDEHDDAGLHRLMTNLAGHDLESICSAFRAAAANDRPTCFFAYTIKGFGLPFAGHKDNHAGLMTTEQVDTLKRAMNVADGDEWEPFSGVEPLRQELEAFVAQAPGGAARQTARRHAARVAVPERIEAPAPARPGEGLSTQAGFGRLLTDLSRQHPELADRIVTASPDVTVSTNLGGWVNRRGIFDAHEKADIFRDERISSVQSWAMSPSGQHIELGIAESNLFTLLAALGLSEPLFGARLLPIGTVYDPFIARGLDALNYACYQDARFILVGTPSGITLAPEGGAHQSIYTPLIGMGQPGLTAFEPAYVDELAEILRWSFEHLQAQDGGSVYLRLSTRSIKQPQRTLDAAAIIAGAYWLVPPAADTELAIVTCGPVIVEALDAHRQLREDIPGAGLMVVTSPDRLHHDWVAGARSGEKAHVERLLSALPATAGLVTVVDAHPSALTWLAAVRGHAVAPLGVERFGQSGDISDLYQYYGLDAEAIIGAAARLVTRDRT